LLILQLVLLILKQALQLLSLLIVSTYEVAQKKRSKYLAEDHEGQVN